MYILDDVWFMVSCTVCMFVERVKEYFFTFFFFFFSVSSLQWLSLDVVSLSVERCCFPLVVDCMYI